MTLPTKPCIFPLPKVEGESPNVDEVADAPRQNTSVSWYDYDCLLEVAKTFEILFWAERANHAADRNAVIDLANEVDQIGEALMSTNTIRGRQLVSIGARIAALAAAAKADLESSGPTESEVKIAESIQESVTEGWRDPFCTDDILARAILRWRDETKGKP